MKKTEDIIADLEARHAKGGKPDSWESAQRYLDAQHGYRLDVSKKPAESCTWQAVAQAVRDQEAPAKAAEAATPAYAALPPYTPPKAARKSAKKGEAEAEMPSQAPAPEAPASESAPAEQPELPGAPTET